ncbi:hypothetical protein ACN47E_000822 [Coniothyrium glycines]
MDGDSVKRKRTFRQESNKKAKKDDGGALKSGFGAKMLAKMGYKGEGGLGKEGVGISEPIQVVMRGTKGGVGIVAEKSEQQKREERRKAEANGEQYADSEDEEREERKKRKAKARGEPRNEATRPRKTLFDLEASGMHVPLALQSIIDATTGASTPASGVSLRGSDIVPFENSLQARVRRDLNSFSDAFEELQIEAQAIPPQVYALDRELQVLERQMSELEDVQARLESLRSTSFEAVCTGIKDMRAAYPSKPLHRESVALIHPHFARTVAAWDPLENALEDMAACFSELANIIQPRTKRMVSETYTHPSEALTARSTEEEETDTIKRGTSSSYETMMLRVWLPAASAAITQWDVREPNSMVRLFGTWSSVLPPFITKRVLQHITHKLSNSIHDWNPRKFKKSPHTWILEWLPFLRDSDLDPKGTGLVADARRKIRHALQSIDLARGPLPGLEQWREVLGKADFDHLLTAHLVPRLAAYLQGNFEINPAEQDLAPLEAIFAWKGLISNEVLGELLKAQFFPKFLDIIHQWLSSEEVVFTEVQGWLAWWRDEILQDEINSLPSVASGWSEAYTLINKALDLGDARVTDLPTPQLESAAGASPTPQLSKSTNREPSRPTSQVEEATFRDVVEEFCAEENLLIQPLKEAHSVTGLPLFRITASATGRGGAVAYMKGDVLWVQNKKDKSSWEPTGLNETLIAKAEGK